MSGCIERNGGLRTTYLADNHLLGCDTIACVRAHCLYACLSICLSVLLPMSFPLSAARARPASLSARILRSPASETYTMWRPGHARRRLSAPTSVAPIVASQKSLDSIVKLDTLRKEDAGFCLPPFWCCCLGGRPVFFISRVHPYVRIRTHAVRMRAWSTVPYTEVEQVIAPIKPRTQNYSMSSHQVNLMYTGAQHRHRQALPRRIPLHTPAYPCIRVTS
jgi:hypothetical protein